MEVTLESRNDIHATAEVVTLALLWKLQILSFTCEAHADPPACHPKEEAKKKANYLSINYVFELEWNKETHK